MPSHQAKQDTKELFTTEEGKDAVQDGERPAVSSFLVQRYALCLLRGAFRYPSLSSLFQPCFLLPGAVGYRASSSLHSHGNIIIRGKAKCGGDV